MNAEPEVTVIIPTHDRWRLLEDHALRSALSQEDVNLEVVVVDDGSTEQAPPLAGLAERRVRIMRHEVSRNVCATRNTGLAAARGEWIAFLDDDDLWSPRKLREQLDGAAAAGADWSYTAAVAVDEAGRVLELEPAPPAELVESLLFTGNHVPGGASSVVARASLIERVGGFDEGLLFLADWDLWLRFARVARPAVCFDPLVARLVHSDNMLFREGANVMPSFERMLAKHRAVTSRDRQTIDEWIAQRYHDAGARHQAARRFFNVALRYRSPANTVAAVGALFGPPGLRAASALLQRVTGTSHLDVDRPRPLEAPEWLWNVR